MHSLLSHAALEAGNIYDAAEEVGLDWTTLRVTTLPNEFSKYEFLDVLKNATNKVSSTDFKSTFAETIRKLKPLVESRKWLAVIVSSQDDHDFSRSLFFFLFALHVCPEISKNLQGILRLPKRFQLSNFFTDFTYVCFDDAVLSTTNIELCLASVSNMPRIVVSPFVGEVELHALTKLGIQVVHTKLVRPFVKFDPSRSNTLDFKYEAYPLFLSHRQLSSVHGFPEVYDKVSTVSNFQPVYVCQKYSRYAYLVQDIVKEFVC